MLHIFDIKVNFLFVDKLFNIDIDIAFQKMNCIFIKNNLKFINIRN